MKKTSKVAVFIVSMLGAAVLYQAGHPGQWRETVQFLLVIMMWTAGLCFVGLLARQ